MSTKILLKKIDDLVQFAKKTNDPRIKKKQKENFKHKNEESQS